MPITSAIVVGGSIAGLLQAIQLKRRGIPVTLLEQDPRHNRHTHESGVAMGPTVAALVEGFNASGRPASVATRFVGLSWRQHAHLYRRDSPRTLSNWGTLYFILRAAFDGMSSATVPHPAAAREGDAPVEYRAGRRLTGLKYDSSRQRVQVTCQDLESGDSESLEADLLIAADGVHSTARRLLGAATHKLYSGYVAWRGTVSEAAVSEGTVAYFADSVYFSQIRGSYVVTYPIPTESGAVETGARLLNWVWYQPLPSSSAEVPQIFTDIHGVTHGNTVQQGLIRPEMWERQLSRSLGDMPPHLADMISSTPRPFVTKVGEVAVDGGPTFWDGRAVLVGDAFNSTRTHLGRASEQAARHCVNLDKVMAGDMTLDEYDRQAVLYARRLVLLNRIVGFTGLNWWGEWIGAVVAYMWLMVCYKMGCVVR